MIRPYARRWLLCTIAVLLAGCSSTTLSGSWKSPDYQGRIGKVYVVGVSASETNRRMFETQFTQELALYGVAGIPSYKDLPDAQNADIQTLSSRVEHNGADSVLITRLVGTRTEQTVTPGRISGGYRSWSARSGYPLYTPAPHYRYWGSYYDRCCYDIIYEPPLIRNYQVATIEANLYEATSGELIWSAQLETILEADLQTLVSDFIKTVAEDLRQQGLI